MGDVFWSLAGLWGRMQEMKSPSSLMSIIHFLDAFSLRRDDSDYNS